MYIALNAHVEGILQAIAEYCGVTPEELVEEMVEGAVLQWVAQECRPDEGILQDCPQPH